MIYSIAQGSNPALTLGMIDGALNSAFRWGQWMEVTSRFSVATAGTYSLSFFAQYGSYYQGCGNCGALIDNVSISAVPLPASALLLLAAVVATLRSLYRG